MKKLIVIITSIFIAFCPCMKLCEFSFADSAVDPDWTFIVDAEHNMQDTFFISAFKAYMNANKAFNKYTYTGEKAIVSWTYDSLNKICVSAGLGSIEDYYDQIAMAVDSDGNFKFWYTSSGLKFMDDLFKAYLQHYGILTDDETKRIFSGKYFEDNNDYGCYITIVNGDGGSNMDQTQFNNVLLQDGTTYRFHGNSYFNNNSDGSISYTLNYNNTSINYSIKKDTTSNSNYDYVKLDNIYNIYQENKPNGVWYTHYIDGGLRIFEYNNILYLGSYLHTQQGPTKYDRYSYSCVYQLNNATSHSQLIDLAKKGADNANLALAKNAVINLGKMGADIGVAAVNHIKDQEEDEPEVETPEEDPTVNPPRPVPPVVDPDTPINPTGVSQDPNGGFNFQMPNLNIDWSLNLNANNLPFPFSIPHDIYNAFNSLNVEAEAPHFEGTVDLYVCEWDIDLDFEDYSSLANIVNKWFLFIYVVGLIIATRSLMHIY